MIDLNFKANIQDMTEMNTKVSTCPICFEDITDGIQCDNNHTFCDTCIDNYFNKTISGDISNKAKTQINCPISTKESPCDARIPLKLFISRCQRETINKYSEMMTEIMTRMTEVNETKNKLAGQIENLSIDEHRNNITELLVKKCPQCGRAFEQFNGCIAVTCQGVDDTDQHGCGCHFCGVCFQICPNDAHEHAKTIHQNVFLDGNNINLLNRQHFRKLYWEYINQIQIESTKNHLICLSKNQFTDILGHDFDETRNRVPPLYGIKPQITSNQPINNIDGNNLLQLIPYDNIIGDLNWYPPGLIYQKIEIDPLAAECFEKFKTNGTYQFYQELFAELGLDLYEENTIIQCQQIVPILEELKLILDYILKLDYYQVDRIKRLAIAIKIGRQSYREKINFFQTKFSNKLINEIQEDELRKLGRVKLTLVLINKDLKNNYPADVWQTRNKSIQKIIKIMGKKNPKSRELVQHLLLDETLI